MKPKRRVNFFRTATSAAASYENLKAIMRDLKAMLASDLPPTTGWVGFYKWINKPGTDRLIAKNVKRLARATNGMEHLRSVFDRAQHKDVSDVDRLYADLKKAKKRLADVTRDLGVAIRSEASHEYR